MRLTVNLYSVDCQHKKITAGIPYEVLEYSSDFLVDWPLTSAVGGMKIIEQAEMEERTHKGLFYKWFLSKSKKGLSKWLDRRQYIKDMDMVIIWLRKESGNGKVILLNKGERTDTSATSGLYYRGQGQIGFMGAI